jgi:class I fructose-bisphosphate aldolase
MMTKAVRKILSAYAGENPGVRTNLARILNHGTLKGTGKMVILPVDQGFEHGPARSFAENDSGYDPAYHFQLALDAGCNAHAAPLGAIEAAASDYAGEIPLILKLNNHDSLAPDSSDPAPSVTGSVRMPCASAAWRWDSPFIPDRLFSKPCIRRSGASRKRPSRAGWPW